MFSSYNQKNMIKKPNPIDECSRTVNVPEQMLSEFTKVLGFGGLWVGGISWSWGSIFEREVEPITLWPRTYIKIPEGIPFFRKPVHIYAQQVLTRIYNGKTRHHLSAMYYTTPNGVLWIRTQIHQLPDGIDVNAYNDPRLLEHDTLLVDKRLVDMYRSHSGLYGLPEILLGGLSCLMVNENLLRSNPYEKLAHVPHCKELKPEARSLEGMEEYLTRHAGYLSSYETCLELGYEVHDCVRKIVVAPTFEF